MARVPTYVKYSKFLISKMLVNPFTLEKVAGCALSEHWQLHLGPNRRIKRILDDKPTNITPLCLIFVCVRAAVRVTAAQPRSC